MPVSEKAVLLLHPRVEAPDVDQPAPVQRTLLPGVLPGQGGVGEQVLVTTLQIMIQPIIDLNNQECKYYTSHSNSCQCGTLSPTTIALMEPKTMAPIIMMIEFISTNLNWKL